MLGLKKHFLVFAWALSLTVFIVGFIAWGQGFAWQFSELSAYGLFPLFGITAFSLMWAHYIVSAKRIYLKIPSEVTKKYFHHTGLAVLAAILLHPGILIWQLWRDGFGLPPGSYYYHYVAPGSRWAVLLAMFSWALFIAYEFHRKFSKRTWWKYVSYSSDVAMIFIFFHALELGRNIQNGWFRNVWIFYGASYLLALIYIRTYKSKQNNEGEK